VNTTGWPGADLVEQGLRDIAAGRETEAAHSRYNALIRTLVSFERACECVS
jgi:hypothetical protein